jgi:hypothetical protein
MTITLTGQGLILKVQKPAEDLRETYNQFLSNFESKARDPVPLASSHLKSLLRLAIFLVMSVISLEQQEEEEGISSTMLWLLTPRPPPPSPSSLALIPRPPPSTSSSLPSPGIEGIGSGGLTPSETVNPVRQGKDSVDSCSPVSTTPAINLSPVTLTPAINPCHGFSMTTNVVDTGDEFLIGVKDTREQLSPMTMTP